MYRARDNKDSNPYALNICAAVAILAGCNRGGSQVVPSSTAASVSRPATVGAKLYVANGGNSVTVYDADAHGDVTPIRTINGSNTGLNGPDGVALDADKNIFVANFSNSVTAYAAGADGNVTPIRTISGSNTGLNTPVGVALDADGNIYIVNAALNHWSVTVYAASANGNVAPIRTITGPNTGLIEPTSVALDSSAEVFVANDTCFRRGYCVPDQVTVYAAGANGDVAPIRTISGPDTKLDHPQGIALDSESHIYVTNFFYKPSVTVYAAGASGNAPPIRTIRGSSTRLKSPGGIALDADGYVYIINFPNNGKPDDNSVTAYGPGATGNVRPIQRIHGSKTGLDAPFGAAVR
jgi:hypothetical protein